MSKKLGLALGSGGARGAAHIGFLQALDENNIKPDFISGCSMGSLVGAVYSKGMTPSEMKEELFSLKTRDIFDVNLIPLSTLGLLRSQKVKSVVEKYLSGSTFKNLKIPFSCVAVDLYSGKAVTLDSGNLVQSVIASCAIPTVFKPVQIDDMLLVDGGIANRVPVDLVKKMGADVVVGVDVLGKINPMEELKNIFGLILRVVDIMDYSITEKRKKKEKEIIDLWIEPKMGKISQYNLKSVKKAYEAGYQAGLKNIEKIKELL